MLICLCVFHIESCQHFSLKFWISFFEGADASFAWTKLVFDFLRGIPAHAIEYVSVVVDHQASIFNFHSVGWFFSGHRPAIELV